MDKKYKLDRITLIMSLLVFSFSALYGFFYFNRDMFSAATNDYSLSESDKKDKDIKYEINELDAPYNYELVDHRYLSSLSNMGELSYYDIDTKKLFETYDGEVEIGVNHKIYLLKDNYTSITVSYLDDDGVKIIDVISNIKKYNKVYYVNNNSYYLVGFILNNEKEEFYLIEDDKISVIESDDYSFFGDSVDNNIIFINDKDHIIVTKDNNSKFGVLDLTSKKINISINNDYIKSIGKNNYIIYNDNKASVYDGSMKRLSITYDYIDKIFNNYIAIRDKKITILDKDLKVISNLDYVIGDDVTSEKTSYDNLFSYYKFKDNLILVDKDNNVILIDKDGKVYIKEIENFSITNILYNLKDGVLHILGEGLTELYNINLKDYYENELISVKAELVGSTIVVDDFNTKHYFKPYTCEELDDIEDYYINFTESIKVKVSRVKEDNEYNKLTLTVKEESINDLVINNIEEEKIFKKINNNYYLFTDNKIIKISKKG